MSLKEKQTARYPPPLEQQQEAGEEIIAATSSSKDLDDAYDVYKKQDATDLDPAEARRVLRKIDVHVLPLLMVTYCLQYLDKSSINFASVYGLKEGTRLVGQDYSWLSSIFYFGEFFPFLRTWIRDMENQLLLYITLKVSLFSSSFSLPSSS